MTGSGHVTLLLQAATQGQPQSLQQLLEVVYDELRRLAAQKMAQERAEHTLQPTALVHEAYLRLVTGSAVQWEGRNHFFAAAAEAMRRILIEAARRRSSLKRGGARVRNELLDYPAPAPTAAHESLLALDDALRKLEAVDPAAAQLVTLRYFGGLTMEAAADTLGISLRTAHRNWNYARAWLQRELSEAR